MVVRWNILFLLLAIVLLLNAGVYTVSRHTMLEGYITLEEQLARDHLERVRKSLQDDLETLVSLNVDWSAWDDTYDFLSTLNPEYISSNLVPSTFDELNLNLIVLLDNKLNVVYSSAYDSGADIMIPVPDNFNTHLSSGSPLVIHSGPESRVSGFVSMARNPMLLSSCPIIRSDMTGPVAGALIMGRYLDNKQLARLADQTQMVLSIVPKAELSSLKASEVAEDVVLRSSSQYLEGRVFFQDIYGSTAFSLVLDIPRDVSLQGRATLNAFIAWNMLLTLAAAVLFYFILDRLLTNREKRLEAEERFRLMYVHSEAGICTVEESGKVLQLNKAFNRIFGYPEEDLVGRNIAEIVNPIDRGWISSFFKFGKSGGDSSGSFDCRFLHQDGKTIWSKVSIGWIHHPVGKSRYATLMVQDVSARKKVEDQLKAALKQAQDAQNRTKAILRSASDGLILVDQNLIVKMINPATEKLLGRSSNELTFRPIKALFDSDSLMTLLNKIIKGESPGDACDVEIVDQDTGVNKHIRFIASPVVSQSGKRDSIIISLHDRTRDFELDKVKNDYIATAAHELRTPLTSVMGFSELLLNEKAVSREERQTYLGYIFEKSQALDAIVDELLDMERVSSGRKVRLNKSPVSCIEFIERVVRGYQDICRSHEIVVDLPEKNVLVNIDQVKIEQVLQNLLNNSVKYSPEGGQVCVKGQLLENEIRVSVEDRGVGMTAEDLGRVFEKFYRSRSTSNLTDGMGLGLTICKDIVEEHGGRIWLASIYGEGTRVYVSLPLE